ncbi:hypothetical protein D9M70_605700 [compost metagenome]
MEGLVIKILLQSGPGLIVHLAEFVFQVFKKLVPHAYFFHLIGFGRVGVNVTPRQYIKLISYL